MQNNYGDKHCDFETLFFCVYVLYAIQLNILLI